MVAAITRNPEIISTCFFRWFVVLSNSVTLNCTKCLRIFSKAIDFFIKNINLFWNYTFFIFQNCFFVLINYLPIGKFDFYIPFCLKNFERGSSNAIVLFARVKIYESLQQLLKDLVELFIIHKVELKTNEEVVYLLKISWSSD